MVGTLPDRGSLLFEDRGSEEYRSMAFPFWLFACGMAVFGGFLAVSCLSTTLEGIRSHPLLLAIVLPVCGLIVVVAVVLSLATILTRAQPILAIFENGILVPSSIATRRALRGADYFVKWENVESVSVGTGDLIPDWPTHIDLKLAGRHIRLLTTDIWSAIDALEKAAPDKCSKRMRSILVMCRTMEPGAPGAGEEDRKLLVSASRLPEMLVASLATSGLSAAILGSSLVSFARGGGLSPFSLAFGMSVLLMGVGFGTLFAEFESSTQRALAFRFTRLSSNGVFVPSTTFARKTVREAFLPFSAISELRVPKPLPAFNRKVTAILADGADIPLPFQAWAHFRSSGFFREVDGRMTNPAPNASTLPLYPDSPLRHVGRLLILTITAGLFAGLTLSLV